MINNTSYHNNNNNNNNNNNRINPKIKSTNITVEGLKLSQELKELRSNPKLKFLFLNIDIREINDFLPSEINVLRWIIDVIPYIYELAEEIELREIWTFKGSVPISKFNSEYSLGNNDVYHWIPNPKDYTKKADGSIYMCDVFDLYYQLLYIKMISEQAGDFNSLLEIQKALLLIKPYKENIKYIYKTAKECFRGLLATADYLNTKAKKINPNHRPIDIRKLRQGLVKSANEIKALYEKINLEGWPELVEGCELEPRIEGHEFEICPDPIAKPDDYYIELWYSIKITDFYHVGLEKYLQELEKKLKPISESNVQALKKLLVSPERDLIVNKAKNELLQLDYQNRKRISAKKQEKINSILDHIQEYNPHRFLIDHVNCSMERFTKLFSNAVANNEATKTLNRFSSIRSLINSDDEYYILEKLEEKILELYEHQNQYSKTVVEYRKYNYQLRLGVIQNIDQKIVLEIRNWLDKVDQKLASSVMAMKTLEFHVQRYLGAIKIPQTISDISGKEILALERANISNNYLSNIEKQIENNDAGNIAVTLNADNLNLTVLDVKILVLTEIIYSGNYIMEYKLEYYDLAILKLKYMLSILGTRIYIKVQIEAKLKVLTCVYSHILTIQKQNITLLADINKILFLNQNQLSNIYSIQVKIINLEKQLNTLIEIYEEQLLNKIQEFVNSKTLLKSVECLKHEWNLNLSSFKLPSTQNSQDTDVIVSNSNYTKTFRELEQILLKELQTQIRDEQEDSFESDSEEMMDIDDEHKHNGKTNARKDKPLVEPHEYTNSDEMMAENILSYYTPLDPYKKKALQILVPINSAEINEFLQQK